MNIAIYMHDLSGGGVERMKLDLIREFRHAGHRVTLLLHRRQGELAGMLPSDVRVIGFDTGRALADLLPIARHLRQERPDVLMSSLNHNNIAALLAGLCAGGRTPVVICQHNALSAEAVRMRSWKYWAAPLLYRLLAPLASGIVAVSDGLAADLVHACGIRRARITTIYNPVLGTDFDARAAEPVSHPWLDAPGPPVYLTAGRLVAQKNQALLLRGFAVHLNQGGDARLMILGSGLLQAELQALARQLGIADRVALTGFVRNPLPFMARAAAFVLTSDYEGFGNAIVEALGVGTPVIATDCPFGPSEILEGGRYGLLVPPGDAAALAAAFSPHLRTHFLPPMLRQRANHFTAARSASQYLAMLRAVVARRASAGVAALEP